MAGPAAANEQQAVFRRLEDGLDAKLLVACRGNAAQKN